MYSFLPRAKRDLALDAASLSKNSDPNEPSVLPFSLIRIEFPITSFFSIDFIKWLMQQVFLHHKHLQLH